ISEEIGVGAAILLGRGEESSGGRRKASILADTLEALIGAVYLSDGVAGAVHFVLGLVTDRITEVAAEARLGDPKNRLQELSASLGLGAPVYRLSERGPDHDKRFSAEVALGERRLGGGAGRSKKEAEREAAAEALGVLLRSSVPEVRA
ncbi:MAG: ribonuclease III family protein, partial [Acidimicrobiales bacterium]